VTARRLARTANLEDAMKKPIRRKPRPVSAGSWLIPIALTAASVVSIAHFNVNLLTGATQPAPASQSSTRSWTAPHAQHENPAREATHRGGPF
jgi:hypothetical protein